jgi:hypothetical protein
MAETNGSYAPAYWAFEGFVRDKPRSKATKASVDEVVLLSMICLSFD